MKSGASQTSENIRLFSVVRSSEDGESCAVIIRGTALSPRQDRLQPNRAGSGKMFRCKRLSERLRQASDHYATRMAFLLPGKHVRIRRLCVPPDRGPENIGVSAFPVARDIGKRREMRLRYPREGRSFSFPNPDKLSIRRAARLPVGYMALSRRTPFSDGRRTIILRP